MRQERKLYHWSEVDDIPGKTGVYAWYYRHSLADFDIKRLIAALQENPAASPKAAVALVANFLHAHLFQPFAEEPYDASIHGPLKPSYQGKLLNKSGLSDELVARIAAEPARLWALKQVLEEAVPEFASPIYIGMAVNLNSRVRGHKGLIERYKAAGGRSIEDTAATALERNDQSFARQVVNRGFTPNGLTVAIRMIDAAENVHVDAENILNRINYPLCGRN
jgi:hypothetical protein